MSSSPRRRRSLRFCALGVEIVTRFFFTATGELRVSSDPLWLMREDSVQGHEGKSGLVYWDPDWVRSSKGTGGQATTMVVEVYDLAQRTGLALRVPMTVNRKNLYVCTQAKGSSSSTDVSVPDASEPRYIGWDLAIFVVWAEREFVQRARRASPMAKYKGDSRILPQEYAQLAEFAGFAFIDDKRTIRNSAARTGPYWFGQAMSIVWKPGEEAAKQQLLASARDKAKDESAQLAFASVWWSEPGIVQTRFVDLATGEALAGSWRIEPKRGVGGFLGRAVGIGENDVVESAANEPTDYKM